MYTQQTEYSECEEALAELDDAITEEETGGS